MAKMGRVDFEELKKFHARCERLGKKTDELYIEALQKAGNYALDYLRHNTSRISGRLGDAWQVSKVLKYGNRFYIIISNPVEYASFYEYGHFQEVGRFVPAIGKRLKRGWVPGRFVLRNAIKLTKDELQTILQETLDEKLKEIFDE